MIRKPIAIVNLTNLSVSRGQTVASSTDLAVTRDKLGRIFIPSTALKGSANSKITLTMENGEIFVKILFGSIDERVGDVELKKHMGLIGFRDAYLVFVPTPSTIGLLYVTSPLLLLKLFEATGTDTTILAEIQEKLSDDTIIIGENKEIIDLAGGITLKARSHQLAKDIESYVRDILNRAGLGDILDPHVGIVSDNIIDIILNKALIIRPGIKIEGFEKNKIFYNKVVDKDIGPRFEEEVPLGSIFIGQILLLRQQIELDKLGKEKEKVKEAIANMLRELDSFSITLGPNKINLGESALDFILNITRTMFIGGKETLAKGLVKIVEVPNKLTITQQRIIGQKNVVVTKENVRIADLEEIMKSAYENNRTKEEIDEVELAKKLNGKVAGLPEKFRMMDPLTVLYFYSVIKGDSEGEGLRELRAIGKYLLGKWELGGIPIRTDPQNEGLIADEIGNYLSLFDRIGRTFTRLKYIIRAYGDEE